MAKWIYERWDYAPNIKTSNFSDSMSARSIVYRVKKDGELDRGLQFQSLSIGDLFVNSDSESNYNRGISAYIHQKESSRYSKRCDMLKKSDVIASIAPTVLVDTIEAEENEYPQNGFLGDYWYKRIKRVFPTMKVVLDGEWVEVETGYVLKDGVWKPIEEIYKLQDGQWVQA